MNALDTKLNYLSHKLLMLRHEEKLLQEKQIALGREITDFFIEQGCEANRHPIEVIQFFRQKKVLETL